MCSLCGGRVRGGGQGFSELPLPSPRDPVVLSLSPFDTPSTIPCALLLLTLCRSCPLCWASFLRGVSLFHLKSHLPQGPPHLYGEAPPFLPEGPHFSFILPIVFPYPSELEHSLAAGKRTFAGEETGAHRGQ